ncbi:type II toxin-antitoxin system HicB family antitoxin [Candidatus Electronema sp. JM]|uniref:type II toxin-antitoxin system HicB family antitoxin n=1 Tax=Candidatus Electronema sp. JM TaxID=3401571 RepID=UPI003AA99C24
MAERFKYPFEIRPLSTEEGSGFMISFPDLPGCFSDGETIEEAVMNGMDAVESWIKTAQEFNDPVPEPCTDSRLVERLPKSLHNRLSACAQQEGVSVNALVTAIIAESLGRRETHV